MILSRLLAPLVDFLFPKDLKVLELESLSPSELLSNLSAPRSLGEVRQNLIVLWNYADPRVRELVWELKYRKNDALAKNIGVILFDILEAELAERALFQNFKSPLLLPMPISKQRRLTRCYNQIEILCEELKALDSQSLFDYRSDLLTKVKDTESQTKTSRKRDRLTNVEDSMEAAEGVRDRHIVLLDDVTTTGATFRDACRALRTAGAKDILCVALAH